MNPVTAASIVLLFFCIGIIADSAYRITCARKRRRHTDCPIDQPTSISHEEFETFIENMSPIIIPSSAKFHPVHQCDDGIFNTVSGVKVNLHYPTTDMISIFDIAHALSNICRFGGHSRFFYSVAQHSVIVAKLAPEYLRKMALLHDAPEAYVGDVIKPLKNILGDRYEHIEGDFWSVIAKQFSVVYSQYLEQIKCYDMEALEVEHEYFQKGNPEPFVDLMKALNLPTEPLGPLAAKQLFIKHYDIIFKPRKITDMAV